MAAAASATAFSTSAPGEPAGLVPVDDGRVDTSAGRRRSAPGPDSPALPLEPASTGSETSVFVADLAREVRPRVGFERRLLQPRRPYRRRRRWPSSPPSAADVARVRARGIFDLDAGGTQDLVDQICLARARHRLEGHGGRDRSKLLARFALEDRTLELFFAHRVPLWIFLCVQVILRRVSPGGSRDSVVSVLPRRLRTGSWRSVARSGSESSLVPGLQSAAGGLQSEQPHRLHRIAQPDQWVPTAADASARREVAGIGS